MDQPSVFVARDGRFVATELARGPWDPGAQHGGAAAALLMRAFEHLPAADGLAISRVTYEFLRPVPIGELEVSAEVVRRGRRVQLVEGSIASAEGLEVARARGLQVQVADPGIPRPPAMPPPPGPEQGRDNDFQAPHRPMFSPDAIEIRFVRGGFHHTGAATAWFRLQVPLIAGETASPLQRLAAAGDFGNGISAALPWNEYLFINPDLTLYIDRTPVGDWICLDAQTIIAPDGIGNAESVIYDERGRIGTASQALLIAKR
jgi:acyl-Coa thioesterase superfamily protein/acyl-CoA thioesterase superfamily protein